MVVVSTRLFSEISLIISNIIYTETPRAVVRGCSLSNRFAYLDTPANIIHLFQSTDSHSPLLLKNISGTTNPAPCHQTTTYEGRHSYFHPILLPITLRRNSFR